MSEFKLKGKRNRHERRTAWFWERRKKRKSPIGLPWNESKHYIPEIFPIRILTGIAIENQFFDGSPAGLPYRYYKRLDQMDNDERKQIGMEALEA